MSLISGSDDAGDLKAVFALFDTDHDEKLSAADAGHAWRLLGFEITAADTMGFVTIELDDWFAATQALSARQCDSVLAGRDPSEAVATLEEIKCRRVFNAMRRADPNLQRGGGGGGVAQKTSEVEDAAAAAAVAAAVVAASAAAAGTDGSLTAEATVAAASAAAAGAAILAAATAAERRPAAPHVVSTVGVLRAFRAAAAEKQREAEAKRRKQATVMGLSPRSAVRSAVEPFGVRAAQRFAEVTEQECTQLLDFIASNDEDGVPDGMLSVKSLTEFMRSAPQRSRASSRNSTPAPTLLSEPL